MESWQTAEAAAREVERERRRREFAERVEREREALERDLAEAPPPDLDLSRAHSTRDVSVGFDWTTYDEEGLELAVLGWIYRQVRHHGDRRGAAATGLMASSPRCGIPSSEAELAPRAAWKAGVDDVLGTTINLDKLAGVFVKRDDDEESRRDGTANAYLHAIREDGGEWRADEKQVHDVLVGRLREMFRRWFRRGLAAVGPVVQWDPTLKLDAEKPFKECRVTHDAVILAEERIRGTKFEHGPASRIDGMTEAQKARVREEAPWYWREGKDAKAGT